MYLHYCIKLAKWGTANYRYLHANYVQIITFYLYFGIWCKLQVLGWALSELKHCEQMLPLVMFKKRIETIDDWTSSWYRYHSILTDVLDMESVSSK